MGAVGNKVYFAPNVTFANFIATNNPYKIIDFYNDRLIGYYFDAAEFLITNHKKEDAFAAGLICFAAIDAIASITIGGRSGHRFKKWLNDNIDEFSILGVMLIDRVYREFRCGLVHEAKIHNAGQFTYNDINRIVNVKGEGIIVINPEKLLGAIRKVFSTIIRDTKTDINVAKNFSKKVKKRFRSDFKVVKEMLCENCEGIGEDPNTDEVCKYCDGSGYDEEKLYANEIENAEDAAYFSNVSG